MAAEALKLVVVFISVSDSVLVLKMPLSAIAGGRRRPLIYDRALLPRRVSDHVVVRENAKVAASSACGNPGFLNNIFFKDEIVGTTGKVRRRHLTIGCCDKPEPEENLPHGLMLDAYGVRSSPDFALQSHRSRDRAVRDMERERTRLFVRDK